LIFSRCWLHSFRRRYADAGIFFAISFHFQFSEPMILIVIASFAIFASAIDLLIIFDITLRHCHYFLSAD
jgi:hypothetical protein